jgi:tetratricopeptide (TPR) repeat protein
MSTTAIEAARRYIQIGRPQRALESLAALESDEASGGEALRLRGYALLALEDYDGAVDAAQAGLEVEPASIELLYLLSLAEDRREHLAEAEAAVLAALEQDADDADLLTQYANVLMHGGALAKAERVLDAAAASDPDSVGVLESRIQLVYLRGDDQEARRLSEQLLAIDPESIRGHHMLGVFDLNRGRAKSAAERYGEVVRADPTNERMAEHAREVRAMARNPLWWPSLLFARVGVAASWVGAMVVIFGLRAAGAPAASGIAGLVWLALCAWSWIVPPILNRLQR